MYFDKDLVMPTENEWKVSNQAIKSGYVINILM